MCRGFWSAVSQKRFGTFLGVYFRRKITDSGIILQPESLICTTGKSDLWQSGGEISPFASYFEAADLMQGTCVWRSEIITFCQSVNCTVKVGISAFRFAIRIYSIHLTNRLESIRFRKKSDRSIRPQLVGVYVQSLSTLTVCTLYAGIIHLVLFHNSVRIDGLPQLTSHTSTRRQCRHSHLYCNHFSVYSTVRPLL